VLRGPQGTLYGASSLGGLIKFVTRQPDTEHFSGRVEAGLESVEGGASGYVTRGTVNLPLITDKMALLVTGFTRQDRPTSTTWNRVWKGPTSTRRAPMAGIHRC